MSALKVEIRWISVFLAFALLAGIAIADRSTPEAAAQAAPLPATVDAVNRTAFDTTADWLLGDEVNLDASGDQLKLDDMTGATLPGVPETGTWTALVDTQDVVSSTLAVEWTGSVPGDASVQVFAAQSTDGITFRPEVEMTNGVFQAGSPGQFVRVRVQFDRATTGVSPMLDSLTVLRVPPPPRIDAGPDQSVSEGDVVNLSAGEPILPGVGAQSLVPSVNRRVFPNDPDASIEVALNGLTNGLLEGTVDLRSFGAADSFALINVIDLSGSTRFDVPGCGEDENGDGGIGDVLDCEILAIKTLNDRLAAGDGITSSLVAFAALASAADVSPENGVQLFAEPTADVNDNGIPDIEEAVRSVRVERLIDFTSRFLLGGTNFAEAAEQACEVAATSDADRIVVAMMSDGEVLNPESVDGILPCGDVVFRTFAVGGNSECDGQLPNLQLLADLTGGTCTKIEDTAELPEIFALTIAPQIVAASLVIDGGAPIDVSGSFDGVLPTSGSLAMTVDTTAIDPTLLDGASEVCLQVVLRDSLGDTPIETCSALRQRSGNFSYQWQVVDRSGPPVLLVGANTATPSFVTADEGTYVLRVTATDNLGQTASDTLTVTVANVDPTLTISTFDPSVGGVALLSGEFTDPGWQDAHSVTIDWGDGVVAPGVVGVQNPGSGTVFGAHVYEVPGAYDVAMTVTDTGGGTTTETVQLPAPITSPAALWAEQSTTGAGPGLSITGSSVEIDGLVHSNSDVVVAECATVIEGTVEYVTELTLDAGCLNPQGALATPSAVNASPAPLSIDFADYAAGGTIADFVPGSWFDKTDRCRDGQWRVHDQDLAPGIYYVDCDVDFSNASGQVTIVATGEIRTSGAGLDFEPFFGSLLFLSGAITGPGVSLSSTDSTYRGAIYGIDSAVSMGGSANTYVCGIYGETIAVEGDATTITGADCGDRPQGAVTAVLQPAMDLTMSTSADVLTPGSSAPFTIDVTNTGSTFVVPGVAGVQNTGAAPLTLDGLELTLETRSPSSTVWTDFAAALTVEVSETAAPGVVYADEPAGTVLDPLAIAVWGFQAVADLTPAQVDALTNPAVTSGIRVRADFATPAGSSSRPLYEVGRDFIDSLAAEQATVQAAEVRFLGSDGDTELIPLGDLAPGAVQSTTVDLPVAVPAPIAPGEPSSAYIARLRRLDQSAVIGAAFAVGSESTARVLAPLVSDNAVVRLPIVDTQKSGPTDVRSGEAVPWSIRLVNVGSVNATAVEVTDTFGAQTLPVEGVVAELTPGQVVTATTSTVIPADTIREFTANQADTTWQDANGNVYGPTTGFSPLDVYSGPSLQGVLAAETEVDADLNGFLSPGDTLRYTATLTNNGDFPVTGLSLSAPRDVNTVLDAASVVGGTLASDPAAETVQLSLPELSALSQSTVSWAVVVAEPFPAGMSTVSTSAVLNSAELDAVDVTQIDTAVVVPFPVVEFTLFPNLKVDADLSGSVTAGDTLVYTGQLANSGNAPAENTQIDIAPQPGLDLVGSSAVAGAAAVVSEGAGTLTLSYDALNPATLEDFTFDAVVASPLPVGLTELTLTATATADGLDPVPAEDPNSEDPDAPVAVILGANGVGPGGINSGTDPGAGSTPGGGTGTPGAAGGNTGTLTEPTVSNGVAVVIDDTPVVLGTAVECSGVTPANSEIVSEPTDIMAQIDVMGPGAISTWKVLTYPSGRPADAAELGTGSGAPPPALASFDPGQRENGIWTILVEVETSDGQIGRCESSVVVEGELKLGRFTAAWEDLNVPIAGVPIQVVRTYDTQDRNAIGDFGNGWDLSIGNFTVQTNTQLGLGPFESETCGGIYIYRLLCYESRAERYVSVTWPDGNVETFDFTPEAYSIVSAFGAEVKYTPRAGATSTLEPGPRSGAPALSGDGNFRSDLLGSGDVFNPQQFILTDTEGNKYLLDRSRGLLNQTDAAGNTLVVDVDGIRSSLGPEIRFARDAFGRITQVTDPEGGVITYTYDAEGDLVSVVDQNGSPTTFGYISDHYLDTIDEPDGGQSQRMTYDDEGRLISITDAAGNVTLITTDVDDRSEIMTSPDGNLVTVTDRDERGNMMTYTEIYDGVSHVTSYTYNANDQVTSRTDPEGNTWTGVYDDDDNLLSFTDAEGNTTTFVYDANNYPTSVTDALGQTSTYTYNERGLLLSAIDARGVSQTVTYDGAGNELSRTDSLGRTWSATYTSTGLLATETDPRGNVTSHTYDASGRLATSTWPDGGVTTFVDDAVGNLVSVTDPLGRVTSYTYDGADRMTTMTDPAGFTMTYTYDGVGRVTSMTDGSGRQQTYNYAFDRLESEVAPDGGTTTYTYDAVARVQSMTDALGRTTSYEYDNAHRRTAMVMPFGNGGQARIETASDRNGRIVSTTNGEGDVGLLTFDAIGQVTSSTDGLGRVTTYAYDASGNMTSSTNANGETTTWTYDLADQLTSVTDAVGAVTSYTYDAAGNMVTQTDPLGRVTTYEYDSMNRPVAITLPSGAVATTTYDLAGQAISSTSAAGVTTTFTYDPRGLLLSHSDELGNTTTRTFDGAGRVLTSTDPRGNTTTLGYDAVGRLATETDPLGGVVTFGYDLAGQRVSVTDPNGATRTFAYDDAGNMVSQTDALGRTSSMVYDRARRPVLATDARGITISRTFDAAGQLVAEASPSETRTFSYDLVGRMVGATDSSGATSMVHDAIGRLTGVTNSAGTVSYAYNAAGERITHTQPQGTISYTYDANGFLETLTDWRGDAMSVTNDADGRMLGVTRSNGVASTYSHDAAGRLIGIAHGGAAGQIDSYTYTLDASGNRIGVTSAAGSETYTLDALHRLTGATYATGLRESFVYDAAGYRTSHTGTDGVTTTATFDAAGQRIADSSGATYTFDAAGNLVGSSTGDAYTFDDFGRMTSATVDGVSQTYGFDAMDVRVTVDGEAQLWDRAQALPTLIESGTDDYVHGPTGVFRDGDEWLLADAMGSIRASTDAAGAVVDQFDFTAFGEPVGAVGTFGFTGEQHDPTGMVHLRARQYQPDFGRFASVDPVQPGAPGTGGWNLYSYSANNPTTWADPSGEAIAIGYLILAGALLSFVMSFWTCDQSGNGWYRPSTNLDMSCVFTETILGGIFAGFGGIGTKWAAQSLGRRLAVGCAWGAVEGGTNAALYGAVSGEGSSRKTIGASALFGCAIGGGFSGGSHLWTNRGADVPTNNGTSPSSGSASSSGRGGPDSPTSNGPASPNPPAAPSAGSSFYTVQSAEDAARLAAGGSPWPTTATRAEFGPGVYAWGNADEAAAYAARLQSRGACVSICEFSVNTSNLSHVDVDSLVDPSAFMSKYSQLWDGTADHGLDYITRGTNFGTQHYFSSDAFAGATWIGPR